MKRFTVYPRGIVACFFCLCLATLLLIGGCGKTGMPLPKKTQDTFTITGETLAAMGDCLVAGGVVNGAIENVGAITLEIAPIDSFGDCPGCPFVAREYAEFTASEAQLNPESGQFMFSFCPAAPAPMLRWRIVGRNVFHGLPFASTTPQVLVLP